MSKTIFNHEAPSVVEAVGLDFTEINTIISSCLDDMNTLQEKKQDNITKSEIIEIVLNKGLSVREISIVTFQLGECYGTRSNPLHELMSMLSEQID